MAIVGGILAVLALLVSFGLQKGHYDQTGVWGPSRAQTRYIRRKAGKLGISEHDAYEAWLARKQGAIKPAPALGGAVASEMPKRRVNPLGWALFVLAIVVTLLAVGSLSDRSGIRSASIDRARVNCRAEAATAATIVKTFSRGDPVAITEDSGGWSKVDKVGCWIRSDLLRVRDTDAG